MSLLLTNMPSVYPLEVPSCSVPYLQLLVKSKTNFDEHSWSELSGHLHMHLAGSHTRPVSWHSCFATSSRHWQLHRLLW